MPDLLDQYLAEKEEEKEPDLLEQYLTTKPIEEEVPTEEPTWWEAAFAPPKEYEEVYAPELGKMVPGKRREVPIGTRIIERLKFEWETDWPAYIGLGIFLGTYGALKAIPMVGESIISKNAAKFAKTNLPVLRQKFPDVIKTAEDAKIYAELGMKSKFRSILGQLGGLRTGEALQTVSKLARQVGNLKLVVPKAMLAAPKAVPAIAEKVVTPATINLTNKLVHAGLDKIGAEALAGSMHLMKEGVNELVVGQAVNDFVDRSIARTADLAPLTGEEKLGFAEMRGALEKKVTDVLEKEPEVVEPPVKEVAPEVAPREDLVLAMKDTKTGEIITATPDEKIHTDMILRLRERIKDKDMEPGWIDSKGKFYDVWSGRRTLAGFEPTEEVKAPPPEVAPKGIITKELEPLAVEAMKYKSAGEFARKLGQPLTDAGEEYGNFNYTLETRKISELSPTYTLQEYERDIAKEFAKDIKKGEYVPPIQIEKDGTIIDGNRRTVAYDFAGIKKVPVLVKQERGTGIIKNLKDFYIQATKEIRPTELPEITPEVKPPTKPPIPPTPPPKEMPEFAGEPVEDPIAKLNELIKEAKPLRGKLEKMYTAERAKRFAEIDKFIDKGIDEVGGEEGFKIILSKMRGELAPAEAKVRFIPVEDKLTKEQTDALFLRIMKHPYLDVGEKLSAGDGLTNLLMGGIPQPKKLVLLEEIYGSELIKNILKKRARGAKAAEFLIEAGNVPRALLATADMSAFLRQGVIELAAHPVVSAKAIGKTFQFAFDPIWGGRSFEQYFEDLYKDPLYPVMRKSGLSITDPARAGMQEREEAFISRVLQKIPVVKVPVEFAERAYVGFLNKVRVDLFKTWADELSDKGFTPTKNPELFKSAADVVNTFTGRGSLGKAGNRITPQLNTLFFSPRLIAARFNALNPVWYAKQPKEIRKKAIGDIAKFVVAGLTVLALVKTYKEATGASDEEISVETDTRSSDSGKIRIGNTRFDIWGGFQQWVRVFTQLVMGQRKNTKTGEIISLTKEEYPFTTRKEVLLRFMEGKLAPVPQLVNELISGAKTFGGEDITAEYITKSKFVPMYIQDIAEAYADGGLGKAVGVSIPAFFGVGVQTWEPRKKKGRKYWWE